MVNSSSFVIISQEPRNVLMFLCARTHARVRLCACTCVSVRVRACVCMCARVLTLPLFLEPPVLSAAGQLPLSPLEQSARVQPPQPFGSARGGCGCGGVWVRESRAQHVPLSTSDRTAAQRRDSSHHRCAFFPSPPPSAGP